LSDERAAAIGKIGAVIAGGIRSGSLLGLGSGTTMAALLPSISKELKKKKVRVRWVPTSLQIALVADALKEETTLIDKPAIDLAIDGADQVDADFNLIKGGGGALFREKVLIRNARRTVIVVDEKKLATKLCTGEVRVPVEAHPFARVPVVEGLRLIGGEPRLRLGERGFPFYTENGNLIFDTLFRPITRPETLDGEIKSISGVIESGIFTPRPIEVFVVKGDGTYETLRKN
jgi:ribose 5-phosphate isomerase A